MSTKYEIQSIKNVFGKGEEHRFARIFEGEAMTSADIENYIQASCSLTKGDVRAALAALGELMTDQLAQGSRFHIPEVGYFSLATSLRMPDDLPTEKIRGNNICVRGINFRPDASLLQRVRNGVRFERAGFSSMSKKYSEEEMTAAVRQYIAANGCITRHAMEVTFGLSRAAALGWLRRLTASGTLRKTGSAHYPVYLLPAESAGQQSQE